jgi:hypothetical protein
MKTTRKTDKKQLKTPSGKRLEGLKAADVSDCASQNSIFTEDKQK